MKRLRGITIIVVTLAAAFMMSAFSPLPDNGIGFRADRAEYSIGDVTLDFYFGLHDPQNRRSDQTQYSEQIFLLFSNKKSDHSESAFYANALDLTDPDLFFIREIDPDEFYSDEYAFTPATGFFGCGKKEEKYNHYEKITIPQAAFDKESGTIVFHLRIERWDISDGTEVFYMGESWNANIYYKLRGDKVEISNQPI